MKAGDHYLGRSQKFVSLVNEETKLGDNLLGFCSDVIVLRIKVGLIKSGTYGLFCSSRRYVRSSFLKRLRASVSRMCWGIVFQTREY